MTELKVCLDCKQELSLESFSFRKDSKTYRTTCKNCRAARQKIFSKTEAGRLIQFNADQRRNAKFKKQRAARSFIAKLLKQGKLMPWPCFVCGNDAEAHHPDYDQKDSVVWLCKFHHREVHQLAKELNYEYSC